jgi:outer membrane protein
MKTEKRILAAVAVIVLLGASDAAMAADLGGSTKDAPQYDQAASYGAGWMIRGRILGVIPDEESSWNIDPNADVSVDNAYVPELDITYFFNNNIAVELIAAVTPHEVKGSAGDLAGVDVGDVWLLPPTLTLQYHFDIGHGIKPYVGAGVNYTVFFNEDAKGDVVSDFDLENSFGWALQAGVDIHLRDNWFFNVDVKKLWLETDAEVNGGAIAGDVEINPWIVGVGLGYRFGHGDSPLK